MLEMNAHSPQTGARNIRLFIILVVVSFISSCSPEEVIHRFTQPKYEVGPLFREFYTYLGGEDILGEAIAPVQSEGAVEIQFIKTGCMVFSPNLPSSQRFKIIGVGEVMRLHEPPVPEPLNSTEENYIGGHTIPDEFHPLFSKLGGVRFVGYPITEFRYNQHKKRYEQYFENLGFYRLINDPQGEVALLEYGPWLCRDQCEHIPTDEAAIDLFPNPSPYFEDSIRQLGVDLTGLPISEAYISSDGYIEQIFERVVLATSTSKPEEVFLRPLPAMVGILNDPYVGPNELPDMVHYAVVGDNGYNILQVFLDYIEDHGGIDTVGEPISELSIQNGQIYHQCFENLCLIHDASTYGLNQAQPELLGYTYKDIYYQQTVSSASEGEAEESINVNAWVTYPSILLNQEQEIWVSILSNNIPLVGGVPELSISLPDGSHIDYLLPPTGEDGQSKIIIPPLDVKNETLILYRVCLIPSNGIEYCVTDDYLVWNYP